jgi:hypothetical protein
MSTPKELHHRAMSFMREAISRYEAHDDRGHLINLRKALPLEIAAANLLRENYDAEPTRSVLCLGAANIAYACGEFSQAKQMAYQAMEGNPPATVRKEIEQVLRKTLLAETEFDGLTLAQNHYLLTMRERAFHLRVEPINKKHSHAPYVDNVVTVLSKYTHSWNNYIGVDYENNLGDENAGILAATIQSTTKAETALLLVDLNFRSFGASIASDTYIMQKAAPPKIRKWRLNLFDRYKKDVIEVDYQSDDEVQQLIKKYDDEQRRRIYTPILALFKPSNPFSLSLTDANYSYTERIFPPIAQDIVQKITPPKSVEDTEDSKKLIRVFAVVAEGSSKLNKSNIIQQDEMNKAEWTRTLSGIAVGSASLLLSKPLEIRVSYDAPNYTIQDDRFDILVTGLSNDELMENFNRVFIQTYDRIWELQEDVSVEDDRIRKHLLEYVQSRSL